MGRIIVIFLVFILRSSPVFAQGIDKLWLMGYACCGFPNFSGINLDFSSGSLQISAVQRKIYLVCTNGEICDANNNLLFYSNGIYIANAQDDTMMNGNNLNPSFYTNNHIQDGLSIPQANLIIPFPDDSMRYYLFHQTIDDQPSYLSFYLYYSIIDMTLDSGRGAVVQKNVILMNDSLIPGRLTACKHANGRDWWLISHQYMTGNVYEYLITPAGIQGPWIKPLLTHRDFFNGQCVFTPQGDKYAYYEPYGDLDIADFDRCTGDFSNAVHIPINEGIQGSGGCAFSPSGRYLYTSSLNYVYQFDTWAPDIQASQKLIGVYDGFQSLGGFSTNFFLSQLAPDGKIYINCANSTLEIHVINYPDSVDTACGLCQHCIQLPAYNAFTIPNFPNYFLQAKGGTICDSLGLPNNISHTSLPGIEINIFPNPARDKLYITQPVLEQIKAVELINSMGQIFIPVYSELKKGEYLELNTASLPPGVYFLEILTSERKLVKKFVKE